MSALKAAVLSAESSGHLAVRLDASRVLRGIGRRLRPPGTEGWLGLSEREQEVAVLAAEGLSNREIGAQLYLSEHTVRGHLTRVFAGLDIQGRAALPAKLAELMMGGRRSAPLAAPTLTERQQEVAHAVAEGLRNSEIAERLGVSAKTVEKHLSEVFVRWGVDSRIEVAQLVLAGGDRI